MSIWRSIVAAAGLAFLAGCTHADGKEAADGGPDPAKEFVGQTLERAVAAYGRPESEQDFADGSRLLAWRRGAGEDGIPCRVLMSVRRDGTVLEEMTGGTCP